MPFFQSIIEWTRPDSKNTRATLTSLRAAPRFPRLQIWAESLSATARNGA